MSTLVALLRLTRPHNALAAGLCTLLGVQGAAGNAAGTTWQSRLLPVITIVLVGGGQLQRHEQHVVSVVRNLSTRLQLTTPDN